jgi:alkanesulfonate monooxygenase SsuD/methylene tetrahydromethanopterin reductase-like flavin-dependent oxidoreductase (luciferase family)
MAMMAMFEVGIFVNNRAAVFLGDRYDANALVALACDAEAGGLDFVAVGDSVLAKPRLAPVTTLAAVAAATSTIQLATGVLQPHLRPPVTLAQELATLDLLSNGRVRLGVGLGTGPRDLVDAELRLAGLTRGRRARAFEEAIEVLRLLWSGPASYRGDIYAFEEIDIGYRPHRGSALPISIACAGYVARVAGHGPNDVHSDATAGTFTGPVERVARLGDGWITGMATPDEWATTWAAIVAAAVEHGRDVEHPGFERRLNAYLRVDDDGAGARRHGREFIEAYHRLPMDDESLDRWLIAGSAEACAERIAEYLAAGVTAFQFVLADVEQRRQLEQFVDGVLPALGARA